MTTTADVKRFLVAEAAEDFVDFSLVLAFVKDDLRVRDNAHARRTTLEIIRELIAENLLLPGTIVDRKPSFVPLEVSSADQATAHFEELWNQLDRDPVPGDIAWFVATRTGQQWLEAQGVRASKTR